jgi:DNA-binding transcriptional ArsR family regulator
VQPADLSTIFAALADPTRRAILARLLEGDAPVKNLAEPFDLSGPAITKHLKVLERAGLISRSREGQQRPCRLEPQVLASAADWIEQYREMWEERLDRLDSYLKSIAPISTRRVPETNNNKTAGRKPTKTPRGERHGHQK